MYICGKCKAEVAELPKGIIRCPVCAYKILYKAREPLVKEVKAV